ncbi:phosphatidylinositol 3,4,5-trisphosphate 3-phosphatase TPTE2-like isoform 1-T5 [Thomomys bottae]
MPGKKPLKIVKFVIYSIQGVGEGNGADLKIEIIMQHKTVFTCTRQTCTVVHDIDTNRAIFLVPNCPDLCDDIKVKFSSSDVIQYIASEEQDSCEETYPAFGWLFQPECTSFICKIHMRICLGNMWRCQDKEQKKKQRICYHSYSVKNRKENFVILRTVDSMKEAIEGISLVIAHTQSLAHTPVTRPSSEG